MVLPLRCLFLRPLALYSRLNGVLHLSERRFIGIGLSTPGEVLGEQFVLFSPWHDMNMEVRHTLANAVIHADERPTSVQALFEDTRQQLDICKQGSDEILWEVDECLIMRLRHEEHMPVQ